MPSQCKVSKKVMIEIDQDEWFNLYLYLGSYWVNTSRDTRLDTILDTGYKVRTRTKESRSIDRAKTENQSWTQGVSTRKSSWNQFQNHLLKKDQFVDDLFNIYIIYRINQPEPGSVCVCIRLRTDRTRIFKSNFKSDNKVMKFLLISYRTSDVIGRLV